MDFSSVRPRGFRIRAYAGRLARIGSCGWKVGRGSIPTRGVDHRHVHRSTHLFAAQMDHTSEMMAELVLCHDNIEIVFKIIAKTLAAH